VTNDEPDTQPLPDLPGDVVARLVAELADRGNKIIACIRTAAVLIEQAGLDRGGLRLAESAGYNLREALDAVVAGRDPVEGGLPVILAAWERYVAEHGQPETDHATSLATLEAVLRRAAEKQSHSSYRARQLLDYLRTKTGVDPIAGDLDPVVTYAKLRDEANTAVHKDLDLAKVTSLYSKSIAWFIQMFTPPDEVVQALSELAAQPWQSQDQIVRLRETATNPHHLHLFLGKLRDPAWLVPLYDAGLIALPQPDTAWPGLSLLGGLGDTAPRDVADLLMRMLKDTKEIGQDVQPGVRFELLRAASQLGPAGHSVAAEVVRFHIGMFAVRALAFGVARVADPAAPIVKQVADAMVGGERSPNDHYYANALLGLLEAGLTEDNFAERVSMVAAKLRRLAGEDRVRFVALSIASLTAELGEEREEAIVLAHYLARMLSKARQFGASTSQLLGWTRNTPGEIGERVTCRILTGAQDIPIHDKISHITQRLSSSRATGDDRDLIDDILSSNPGPDALQVWAVALGEPSPAPSGPEDLLPEDWARAWRWSLVLPEHTLTRWEQPIAYVNAQYGQPQAEALDQRFFPEAQWGQSPYCQEELVRLPVLEAAALIAEWRPDDASGWALVGARELARTLEMVVKADLDRWTTDPVTIVQTLREPVYVLHYFQALAESAREVGERASAVVEAARLARTARWEPTCPGRKLGYQFWPGLSCGGPVLVE
jgi:hypothetical protein